MNKKPIGWRKEPMRHSLASRGIKTNNVIRTGHGSALLFDDFSEYMKMAVVDRNRRINVGSTSWAYPILDELNDELIEKGIGMRGFPIQFYFGVEDRGDFTGVVGELEEVGLVGEYDDLIDIANLLDFIEDSDDYYYITERGYEFWGVRKSGLFADNELGVYLSDSGEYYGVEPEDIVIDGRYLNTPVGYIPAEPEEIPELARLLDRPFGEHILKETEIMEKARANYVDTLNKTLIKYHKRLQKEYDYQRSDEAVERTLRDGGYEFDSDGNILV